MIWPLYKSVACVPHRHMLPRNSVALACFGATHGVCVSEACQGLLFLFFKIIPFNNSWLGFLCQLFPGVDVEYGTPPAIR